MLAKINGSVEAQNILGEIKNTVTEKTEKLMTYGFLCIFVGVMLSVFQQAVGIIAEVFPNTIRGAAVAIAVAFQWIFNWIVSTSFVPLANSMGYWFTYGLYGVICIIAAIFVWKLVPETEGKTLEDMTKLWKKN